MKKDMKTLAARLEKDVFELCQPGGRMVGTPEHAQAEAWVKRRLSEIGCKAYRGDHFSLPYRVDGTDFTNFAGVIPGADRSLPPLLIGAHYDSVIPYPCADDNGAAVAITLAVGEAVAKSGGLERDLIIAIFDAEEPPYFLSEAMGSTRFYEDQTDERGIHFAMISDLVGHDVTIPSHGLGGLGAKLASPLKPLTFMTGAESHPELPGLLDETPVPDGMKLIATLNEYVGDMSDHAVFRWNSVPYLFLSCGHWEHYHQPTDTPERLNYDKMAAIATYAESVCRKVAGAKLKDHLDHEDPIAFEAKTWEKALGLFCKPVAMILGVPNFKTRHHIMRAAGAMRSLGL
ncbi:MAG: hypothetical protein RL346_524 [Verrucomicrobiota bacterium]|jgi:hypothetical protein